MEELGLESLFLNNVQNIRYISGYTGTDSYILISPKGKWFITDYRYTEQAKNECVEFEVIERNRQTTTLGQCVNQILKDNNIKNIGFERDHINYGMLEDIKMMLKLLILFQLQVLLKSLDIQRMRKRYNYKESL